MHPKFPPSDSHSSGPLITEHISVLRGANYFSAGPVILMRLNLNEYDERFTNTIEGFAQALHETLPTLYEHHCSEGQPGGFLKRVNEGTLLGHVAEHVAIELQTLAGMDVRFGKTRSTKTPGVYNVVFRFFDEVAGMHAGKGAVEILNKLLLNKPAKIQPIVKKLFSLREERMPGPSTQAIIDEAQYKEIPVLRLDRYNLIQLGTGKYLKRIRATLSPDTGFVALENAKDTFLNTLMLRDGGIPVPITILSSKSSVIEDFHKKLGKQIIIKSPVNKKNRRVYPALNNPADILRAIKLCKKEHPAVLAQEYIPGETYRLLVINNKFVAATHLHKPEIIGNGKDSIASLIEQLNESQGRMAGDKSSLTLITLDKQVKSILAYYGYSAYAVPDQGVRVVLSHHSSPSQGAITEDVTGIVHPLNRFIAERSAEISGLDVAGVNIVCPDISKALNAGQGAVINVLAGPDFRMHINPYLGKKRNVAKSFVEMIFPHRTNSKIPVFSVTGSAGKSVCAYLINYVLEKEGYRTGLTHSDGIYTSGKKIVEGNMAGHEAAKIILRDPGIDYAVFETSVESIIHNGLGYDRADVGIVLNAHNQALPIADLVGAEDIAYAQSVVAEEVLTEGFSIINANDSNVSELAYRIHGNLAMFSVNTDNEEFKEHVANGGWGAGIESQHIFIWNDGEKTPFASLKELPLVKENIHQIFAESLLAAILALATHGISIEKIRDHLLKFRPAEHYLHGRLLYALAGENKILIDKPSGPLAFSHLKQFLGEQKGKNIKLLLDLSGELPDDIGNYLQIIRSDITSGIFCFNSSAHSSHRYMFDGFEKDKATIISLREYYLTSTAKRGVPDKPETKGAEGECLLEGFDHEITYLKDEIRLISEINQKGKNNLIIILSWNYSWLRKLLQGIIEFI